MEICRLVEHRKPTYQTGDTVFAIREDVGKTSWIKAYYVEGIFNDNQNFLYAHNYKDYKNCIYNIGLPANGNKKRGHTAGLDRYKIYPLRRVLTEKMTPNQKNIWTNINWHLGLLPQTTPIEGEANRRRGR